MSDTNENHQTSHLSPPLTTTTTSKPKTSPIQASTGINIDNNNNTSVTNNNNNNNNDNNNNQQSNNNNNKSTILLRRPVLFKKILRGSIVKKKTNIKQDLEETATLQERRKINLNQLQNISFYGIPDSPKGLRSISWRVLLGLLPLDPSKWKERLNEKRFLYKQFINDFITTQEELLNKNEPTFEDNPLSTEPTSQWNIFYQDEEIKETIAKDVHRTHPGYSFFTQGNTYEVMKRMLFIFAKLNPGVSYIQGMNEVLAPLYYVFMTDTVDYNNTYGTTILPQKKKDDDDDDGNKKKDDNSHSTTTTTKDEKFIDFNDPINVEADTFWCFMQLMGEIKDWFIPTLDKTSSGINGYIDKYSNILVRQDPKLAEYLDLLNIDPKFYTFRWITTMLSREFVLPDTVRLWDSLFSDSSRFDFLIYICCAMVIRIRTKILKYDFGQALKMLQTYPPTDLNQLLLEAQVIKENEQKYLNGELANPLMVNNNNNNKRSQRRVGGGGNKRSGRNQQQKTREEYRKDVQEVVKAAQANAQIASEAISSAVSSGSLMAKKWYRSFSDTFDEWSSSSNSNNNNNNNKNNTNNSGSNRRRRKKKNDKKKMNSNVKNEKVSVKMTKKTKSTKSVFDILSTDLGLKEPGDNNNVVDDTITKDLLNDADAIINETNTFIVNSSSNDDDLKINPISPIHQTKRTEDTNIVTMTTEGKSVVEDDNLSSLAPPTKQLSTSPILIDKKKSSDSQEEFVLVG